MKTVKVVRKEWGRGYWGKYGDREDDGASLCRNTPTGIRRCCLGFACKDILGFDDEEITGHSDPRDVITKKPLPSQSFLFEVDRIDSYALVNDCEDSTDKEKERMIAELGKADGVEWVFV